MVFSVKTKICGITRLQDAETAVEAGAWAIGLNNWEGSKRYCEPEQAIRIGTAMRRQCEVVGVFVNASVKQIAHAAEEQHLTMVQLHGEEGPALARKVAAETGCEVIKAIQVRGPDDVQLIGRFHDAAYHLLDASGVDTDERGGTGESFDWSLVWRRRTKIPMILAGGLTHENVSDAVMLTRPEAVDVASGVEVEPGVKDPILIEKFIEAANESGREVAKAVELRDMRRTIKRARADDAAGRPRRAYKPRHKSDDEPEERETLVDWTGPRT